MHPGARWSALVPFRSRDPSVENLFQSHAGRALTVNRGKCVPDVHVLPPYSLNSPGDGALWRNFPDAGLIRGRLAPAARHAYQSWLGLDLATDDHGSRDVLPGPKGIRGREEFADRVQAA